MPPLSARLNRPCRPNRPQSMMRLGLVVFAGAHLNIMKTFLAVLMVCGWTAALNGECVERPKLTAQYYSNPPRLYMTWTEGPDCFWWYMEQSTSPGHWRTYTGPLIYEPNGSFWYTIASATNRATFYRLRLVPGPNT